MENNLLAAYGISAEEEKARWQKHRFEQLRDWAALSFEAKVQSLEEMESVALAIGNQFDPLTGRLGQAHQ